MQYVRVILFYLGAGWMELQMLEIFKCSMGF